MIWRFLITMCLASLAASAAAQPMTCTPTRADAYRLQRLPDAWRAARADVIGQGSAAALRKLGVLVTPRLNLTRPQPTPGRYRCRTLKLGAAQPGMPALTVYDYFRCQVDLTPGGDLILRKLTGSQRPVGLICPIEGAEGRTATRFVGVLQLGSERRAPAYGAETDRDLVGVVQRTGPEHWRIAFPWPAYESKLDILELRREPSPRAPR